MSTVSPAVSDSQGTSPTFARGRPGPTSNVVAEAATAETKVVASSALAARSFLVMEGLLPIVSKRLETQRNEGYWTYNPAASSAVKEKVRKRNRHHNAQPRQ